MLASYLVTPFTTFFFYLVFAVCRLFDPTLEYLQRKGRKTKHAPKWIHISYEMILGGKDVQLVISMALLIAALIKLHVYKDISIYHFCMATDIAVLFYYGSATATFTRLFVWMDRKYNLKSIDKPYTSKSRLGPKRTGIGLLAGASTAVTQAVHYLVVILLHYSFWVWARALRLPSECPAFCALEPTSGTPVFALVGRLVDHHHVILGMFFTTRLGRTCSDFLHMIGQYLRRKLLGRGQKTKEEWWTCGREVLLRGIIFGIENPDCASILFAVFSQYLTSKRTMDHIGHVSMEDPEAEGSMGFGQIIPVVLLALSLLQLLNSISGTQQLCLPPELTRTRCR